MTALLIFQIVALIATIAGTAYFLYERAWFLAILVAMVGSINAIFLLDAVIA